MSSLHPNRELGVSSAPAAQSTHLVPLGESIPPSASTRDFSQDGLLSGRYDPTSSGTATMQREERDQSIEEILRQLESIQQGNPKKIVILGTRHCTFLHQQIVELLSYALVLSGNHVFTSGAVGTHTAVIRGALRAENQTLLTVILPQTIDRQPEETRELLSKVTQVIQLGHNDLPLSVASRLCNSELLTKAEQLIIFAFHDSHTLKEAVEEGKGRGMLVSVLYLD